VGLGTEDRALAVARYGARLGARANYRAYAKFTYRDAQVLSTGDSAEDPLRRGQTGFRIDWDRSSRNQFTVQGDLYVGRLGLRNSADTPVSGGDLVARWTHVGVRGQRWETKVYYDRVARTVPGQVGEKRNTVDFEIQQELTRGTRHHIVWGGGYRASSDHTASTVVFFDPSSRTTQLGNVFAQDEIAFGSAAAVTLGTKLERNTYTGLELQPTLRGRSRVGRIGTAWGAVSRAVRMPTRFDTDIRVLDASGVLLASGNPDFEPEELVAYEGGFRTLALKRVSFDVSVYRNVYDNLRSQELGASTGALITLDNGITGRVVGAEFGTNVQLSRDVQLHGSYTRIARTLTRTPGSRDITGGEGNDPRHMATLQVFTTPAASLSASMLLRYVGELPNPLTPGYTDADAVVNWQVTARAELQFVGQNIFHESHAEFPQAAPVFELVQRNLLVRLNLRLR
jgi:iron complex outermembrane receptor protein